MNNKLIGKVKVTLRYWLRCKHKHFEYEFAGGKTCPYSDNGCECDCSVPVYEVYCRDCDMNWILGENELIDFFARQRKIEQKINKEV